MKTSNQLVITVILGIIISMVGIALFNRMATSPKAEHFETNVSASVGHTRTMIQAGEALQSVEINGPFEVVLKPGASNQVQVRADEDVFEAFMIDNKNGKLTIQPKSELSFQSDTPMRVEVMSNTIETLTLTDNVGARLEAHGLKQDKLQCYFKGHVSATLSGEVKVLSVDGGGTLELKSRHIESDDVSLNWGGHSSVSLSGQTSMLSVNLEGSSTFNAQHLIAKQALLVGSGAINAKVHAEDNFAIKAQGNTHVICYGHPKVIQKEVTGASKVKVVS
ncbi:MAG: DUF2807 domain-containing protein [Legionellaceae bacterium]|nr:DUF2807 domain-containing protein [Legionellaceae bacterium]